MLSNTSVLVNRGPPVVTLTMIRCDQLLTAYKTDTKALYESYFILEFVTS